MSEFNYETMADQVYNDYAALMHEQYITPDKMCDGCKLEKAIKINRWGTIKAFCQSCLDEEYRKFEEAFEEEWNREEE